eukprot:GHVU01153870.1.p1 GENE.GHVU01153870.1~~GHVU01153870.1.p1  ORF type:complete len:192 (-),score=40.23 GHVU01153870.1:34-552(-)
MAPKFDPTEIKYVYLRCVGGEVGATAVLAPRLGPLGMSPKKVGEDIAKETAAWKGMRVQVKLTVQNREAKIEIVPTATALLIRELKEPVRDRKKSKAAPGEEKAVYRHDGNLTLDQVVGVAKILRFKSMAAELKGTVLEILGTCNAIGCTVDDMKPTDVQEKIASGEVTVEG